MTEKGKVWLAGAGPGDAGLLTVKTRQLLCEADVIVYDALVSEEILCQIPDHVERIYVGKRSGHHPVPQEEINAILLQEAQKGKRVLRLKGGDPFVFGRGGEELELLTAHQIPYEIVPGVTSASAVPAYAGIPVTHRDYTSSFHVITGHPRKGGKLQIDFDALVRLNGTLIFLMGITAMESICSGLLEAGMEPDMPAAVLERGTTAAQRSVVSDVKHLPKEAKKAGLGMPAIIVVGKVCRLGEQFHWAEKRVLGGRQFLITRPRQHSSSLARKLRDLGAQVLELPAIRTEPVEPNPELTAALEQFGTSAESWLVFTSPIGVATFFEQLEKQAWDIRKLFRKQTELRIAAIGSATGQALRSFGLIADLVPDVYDAAHLGRSIAQNAKLGSEVLIVRAKDGSEALLPPLENAGLSVQDVALYETVCELHEALHDEIVNAVCSGEVDAVTFTSASTVHGFVQSMKLTDYTNIRAVCIGEQTAKEAERYGMQVQISDQATIDSLVEKLLLLYGKEERA